MTTVTTALVLQAVLQYGPSVLGLIQKLVADIEAGKANDAVSAADLAELVRLSNESASDIYLREGVSPPPKAT